MTMGRPNKGIGHVDNLEVGPAEKARLRAILATISGELSVSEACEMLGIGRARFAELRAVALQGAAEALAPGRPGRPRQRDVEHDELVAELAAENERLGREAHSAWVRAEVALAMPDILAEYEKRGAAAKQRRSEGRKK